MEFIKGTVVTQNSTKNKAEVLRLKEVWAIIQEF